MRLKFYTILVATLALWLVPGAKAEKTITIEMSDSGATNTEVAVSDIEKIQLSTTEFSVILKDNSAASTFTYSQIKRITFGDRAAVGTIENAYPVAVMPNPVRDILTLRAGDEYYGAALNIYSVTGANVLQLPAWNGETIDVAHLEAGVYIINIQSVTIKFIKL